jgi:FAD/FMN-containing dehydrogenase/Fe-S oxidoreductase
MIPRLKSETSSSLHSRFVEELMQGFGGELSVSYSDRNALATDNSIYQRTPQAVAFPTSIADLQLIARLANQPAYRDIKLAPRGGGTGTNGQSLSDGVVVDVSRNMNRILEIDPERGWARVQAGVVKDQLNAALRPHGLFFAPELSTSNRATIGGMISTDASGQGSCLYGKTRDHVLELTTVLMDGTSWTSSPIDDATLADVIGRDDRIGAIHRTINAAFRRNAEGIAATFPRLNRCLTGYDLAHIRDRDGCFDLNAILCGSEGTLGFVAEAKLRVLPLPRACAIVNVRYASFDAALRDAPNLIGLHAASVETVDSLVLELGRDDSSWPKVGHFFPDDPEGAGRALNLVEFIADSEEQLDERMAEVERMLAASSTAPQRRGYTIARNDTDTKNIWEMRKRAAGHLGNVRGDKRPIPFVEDTAVPPERLADYIAEFRALLDRRGLKYGMFGHVDAGVLHVRPAIDMKDPKQEVLIREITDEVAALTMKYGGLLWGEHGKGLRSEYGPAFFGPLYPVLQSIKAAFDPRNQLNPGKIATPPGEALLKLDAVATRGQHDRQIAVPARSAFADAVHCNGNGACFNFDPDDAMCPSWKATRDRRHSPKGRAALMREWLRLLAREGTDPSDVHFYKGGWADLPYRAWNSLVASLGQTDFSHEVKSAMDGCLACKSCVGQCPIKVDVPAFRSKFLSPYHSRYLRPPKDLLLALLEPLLPVLARVPAVYNGFVSSNLGTTVLGRLGLVAIPRLSGARPETALSAHGVRIATPEKLRSLDPEERAKSVVLVQDAFTSYFETGLIANLARLIKGLGYVAWLAPFKPNGKPLQVNGRLSAFVRRATENAEMLNEIAASGVRLVGVDPSMTLTYRSEYVAVLNCAAPEVLLPQEWLRLALKNGTRGTSKTGEFYLLPHCTERTNAAGAIDDWRYAFEVFGAKLSVLASGCCGMAGTYGHEREHRRTSEIIYRLSWAALVGKPDYSGRLLATGYSCRSQAKLIDGVELRHPIQILADLAEGKAATTTRRLQTPTGI